MWFAGKQATFYCEAAIEYGTKFVGGVNPNKAGTKHLDFPGFVSVKKCNDATKADYILVLYMCKKSYLETLEAEVGLIV